MPIALLAVVLLAVAVVFGARPVFNALAERLRSSSDVYQRLEALERQMETFTQLTTDQEHRLDYMENSNTPEALERRIAGVLKSTPK